jgi:hypothetical protein
LILSNVPERAKQPAARVMRRTKGSLYRGRVVQLAAVVNSFVYFCGISNALETLWPGGGIHSGDAARKRAPRLTSMKQAIVEGLSSARRKLSRMHTAGLPRVNVEEVAKALDVEKEARKLGTAGLPPAGQTALTAVEERVVQRMEGARRDCVRWASERVERLNQEYPARDVSILVSQALAADKTFERKAAAVLGEHEHLLTDLAHEAETRERDLADFRARNGLTRSAGYPEGSATFARYAILLALIVVEGVANAYFFSQGLESGLIGGFLAAGLFAAVNLVTAFVLGKYAVPLVFHRNPVVVTLGVLGAVFAVVWIIAVGLTIAHFRDALVAGGEEPARAAWIAFRSAPYELRDVMSWLLFSISVLFAVFALFDGLSSDDRYPGYGRAARRARESREDYIGELQAIRSTLEASKGEALRVIEDNMRAAQDVTAALEIKLREKKWTRTQLEAALLDAESCLSTLIRMFREHNKVHRAGTAVPLYFESRPALTKLALPDFGLEEDRAKLETQQQLVQHLTGQIEHVRANLESAYETAISKLRPDERRLAGRAARPMLVGSSPRPR